MTASPVAITRSIGLGPSSLSCNKPWQTSEETSFRYTYFVRGTRAQALRIKSRVEQWLLTRHSVNVSR